MDSVSVPPRSATGGMFLSRDDNLVAGSERQANGLQVQRLACIPRQRDLSGNRPEQAGQSGDHLVRDRGLQIMFPVQRLPGDRFVAGGHSLHDLDRRHPEARIVHVGQAGVEDELRTHLRPGGIVFPEGWCQDGAIGAVPDTVGAPTPQGRGSGHPPDPESQELPARET